MDQILSLCSGIGGLDIGFHAGLREVGGSPRTIGMVERETFCAAVLANQMQKGNLDDAPIWLGDLGDLSTASLPRVDWIIGGYPCQPFSSAGKRLGEDDPRHLWPTILQLIRTLRPRGVFFENVSGHMSLGLDRVLQDLEGCGFRSAFGLFTAAEVGAPHRRERVFILGMANSEEFGRRSGPSEPGRNQSSRGGATLANSHGYCKPGESRRTSGEVPAEGEGLRGWQDEGQAGKKFGRSRPPLANSRGGRLACFGSGDDDDGTDARRADADGCDPVMANGKRKGLEGDVSNTDQEGWKETGRPLARCGEHRGGWRQVTGIADCDGDHEGGELFCPCGVDYIDCLSPGPTEDGYEFVEADGVLYGRPILGWPARPGEPQHEWEPPRVVEPGLGRSADGVPSGMDRIDRLRALGNSVVPQCAEKAMVNLWRELNA